MGKKHKGNHPLVVAREKAEAAYLAAWGQPASVLVPLWEAWSAAQKACINNKPQLKGCVDGSQAYTLVFEKPNCAKVHCALCGNVENLNAGTDDPDTAEHIS